jgi:hypothetical protein
MHYISTTAKNWAVHYLTKDNIPGVEFTYDVPGTVARLESLGFVIIDILDGG